MCFNSFYSLLYLLQNLGIDTDEMGGDWFWGLSRLLKCHPLAHKMWDNEKSLTEVFVSCFLCINNNTTVISGRLPAGNLLILH